jgi:von Willebrand factor type A domain-containing protein
MRSSRTWLGVVLGGLIAAAVAAPSQAEEPGAQAAAACAKATNVEAIIDDSGSMAITDPNRLRVQAMDLLINALDGSTQLGAVEFGSSFDPTVPAADVVFPAEPIGPNAAAMKSALDTKVQSDAGSTDYNAAFTTGRAANPGAQARIFLTDGGHNVDAYANTHLNPAPQAQTPTYVIGFSSGLSQAEDQDRLKKIATDTGGKYFPLADSSALQSVMNEIGTTLTCQSAPKTFNDALAQGKSKAHAIPIGKKARSAQVAISWASPLDKFKITGIRIVRGGKVVATAARKRHLKVRIHKGSTFAVVKLTRLVKGKLRFAVKATKIGSGQPKVTLTTQVSQTLRR